MDFIGILLTLHDGDILEKGELEFLLEREVRTSRDIHVFRENCSYDEIAIKVRLLREAIKSPANLKDLEDYSKDLLRLDTEKTIDAILGCFMPSVIVMARPRESEVSESLNLSRKKDNTIN